MSPAIESIQGDQIQLSYKYAPHAVVIRDLGVTVREQAIRARAPQRVAQGSCTKNINSPAGALWWWPVATC